MHNVIRTTIIAGEPARLRIEWRDFDGTSVTPSAVRYRVFDSASGSPIGSAVSVGSPSSEMSITVPGSAMPGSRMTRVFLIQVEGTIDGQISIVLAGVSVEPALAMS